MLHSWSICAIIQHDFDSRCDRSGGQSHDSRMLLGQHHWQAHNSPQLVSHAQSSGSPVDTVLPVPQTQSGCDRDRSDLGRSGHMGHVQKPGIAGLFYCCYFFYIGGILSLPYHFYHHAHKMLCDHDHSENFFLFDTDLAVSLCQIALAVLHAVPSFYAVITLHHPSTWCTMPAHIVSVSPSPSSRW